MLRLIIGLPFLLILVIFVASNTQPVMLNLLYPQITHPLPLAIVVLLFSAAFFLLGALMVWFGEIRQRRRARRAEQAVRVLEQQVADLKAQLAHTIVQGSIVQGSPLATPREAPGGYLPTA